MKHVEDCLIRVLQQVGNVYNTLLPRKKTLSPIEVLMTRDKLEECYRTPSLNAFEIPLAKRGFEK